MAAPDPTPAGMDGARAVKCSACGSDNRGAAKFCKGCGGKLAQAWHAGSTDAQAPTHTRAQAAGIVLTGQPLRPEPMPPAPQAALPASATKPARAIKTIVLVATAALALATIVALVWSQRGREIEPPAPATMDAPTETLAVPAAPAPIVIPVVPRAVMPAPAVMAETVELAPVAPPAAPAKPARKRVSPKVQAPVVVAEAPPPPEPVAPAPPPPPPAPQATCGSLNFIAKARCLAAECAKPGISGHAQCDAVRRQQRIDEEKRNPSGG